MAIGAVVAGLARGIGGAVAGNQQKQKNKGLIGKAYQEGRKRLNLVQGDTRQSFGEGLTARGLHMGGNVRASGAVKPEQEGVKVTASINRDLIRPGIPMGGINSPFSPIKHAYSRVTNPTVDLTQATDLGGQQQADLLREQQLEQNELRTAYDTAITNNDAMGFQNVVGNIAAGIDTGSMIANAFGVRQQAARYPGSAFGIDPVDPFRGGPWAPDSPVSTFNIFDQGRA